MFNCSPFSSSLNLESKPLEKLPEPSLLDREAFLTGSSRQNPGNTLKVSYIDYVTDRIHANTAKDIRPSWPKLSI